MGENLYEVDHFYTGDFAQFLTGGYIQYTFFYSTVNIKITTV